MALINPFDPSATPDQTPFAGVDPDTFNKVRSEWDAFLTNPAGRASLLSAGLALMQPPSFGDTGASQVARAIGAGGQSAALSEAQDLKRTEAESKDAMRESAANSKMMAAEAAQTRAGAAADRLTNTGAILDLKRADLERKQQNADLQSRIRLSGMYQNYVATTAKANANAKLMGQPEAPILPMGQWIQANPTIRDLGLAAPSETPDEPVPAAADTTSRPTLSAADRQALEWARSNPSDPRAAKIKARLGVQ